MLLSTCLVWALGFFFVDCVLSQELVSPCPRIFKYEQNASEPDRWYGTATVSSDQDLIGVWFRVILDSKSLQLGNWFGEVETRDNDLGYLIKNPNFRLKARKVLKIKFFVRYNPNEPPPKLVSFRLNAVMKCPEGEESTESALASGQLYTNKPRITNQFSNSSGLEISDKQSIVDSATCGIVEPPRPLTSQFINEGKFPWHATLYHSQQIDLTYVCGASLISSQYLVTAAHCVTKKKSTAPVNTENLVAYLGKVYLQNWKTPGIQDKRIEQIIVHPKYNPQSLENNIAVLKLTEPIELTSYVRPICLWEGPTNSNIHTDDQSGSIVGWGLDENGKVTGQLLNADLSIVSQETCISSFSEIYSKVANDSIFCARFENGTSVCNGDSGSGLMLLRPGSNQNPVWQIKGLVSVNAALQNGVTCDSSHYVVFTDIAKYLDFVKQSMNL